MTVTTLDGIARKRGDRAQSRDYFKQRMAVHNKTKPFVSQAAKLVEDNLAAWEGLGSKIEGARKPANFELMTPEGQATTMRQARREALADSFVTNAKSKAALKRLRANLDAALLPKLPERSPNDLLGELRAQEMRAMVRSLSPEQRANPTSLPPALQEAIVQADPIMSGVPASVHAMLRERIAEQIDPQKMADYREATAALEDAEIAIAETEREIKGAAEFANEGEYKQYAAKVIAPALVGEAGQSPVDSNNDVDAWIAESRRKHGIAV